MEANENGLRARKRESLRRHISDTATRLFMQHGFDAVSVEQVAREADVSKATIFNYFECKEDLLLDRAPQMIQHVRNALADSRAAEALPALRNALVELVIGANPLAGSGSGVASFWAMVASNPSLRARAQQQGEELTAEVAQLLQPAYRKDAPLVATLAIAAWWFAWRQAVESLQAGHSIPRVRKQQRTTIERAFSALEIAFPPAPRPTGS